MQIIFLDQYEFAVSSEESLRIAIKHSKYSQDIESFYRKTGKVYRLGRTETIDLPEMIFVGQLQYSSRLIFSLQRHQQILLQRHDRCISLFDEWNVNDYIVFYSTSNRRYRNSIKSDRFL